jgi:hypothetical protein
MSRRVEEEWIWGQNTRGGGGAPLKQGANLRLAVQGREPYREEEAPRRRSERDRDTEYPANVNSPGNVLLSPPKFMSAIKDMHLSMTQRDRADKHLKEMEYQGQLREQIEVFMYSSMYVFEVIVTIDYDRKGSV